MQWKSTEVTQWLKAIGMHQYIKSFNKMEIDGHFLVKAGLDHEVLAELGVKNKEHVATLLRESKKLV